ncbi:MAG TPA: class I SAM-dependent methyltransferase [Gaiellaceae bacterium]|nr:class I SAM-dependent methyltransferase [Gaiellaceae bacterium]
MGERAAAAALRFAARVARRAQVELATEGARHELARAVAPVSDHGALFDAVSAFEFVGVRVAPLQRRSEFVAFLDLVAEAAPRTVLEIGTAAGGTLLMFARVAQPDAVVVGVDWATAATGFGGDAANARRRRLYESFGRDRQRVHYLFADSHAPETLDRVRTLLHGRAVDLLFVDGDHRYEGVERDFAMYAPLVGDGGIVAFHDIVPGPPEAVGGVPEFWQRVKTADAVELVEDWSQGGYGIGVIRR